MDEDEDPCSICGFTPCDCDHIYDSWKERDL